ncbi:carboxymuconolactone decarboxylase family protein [Sporolactobacillus laevolacticus]|uniref:Carboxymuconolactone decarboxylase n=1 Tax=Sporolactobacillus laevolacticus DSM 442 TaxID=1395513 RepID=V6J2V3_9BACL|nr:carboxymuconolactone decarboxylase family protein [Sporolactobacillus laevolacticus]EST11124.1 carboxymuconolactone decarboxylase [Sporolactobacillus laevolacticus DSM 442]MDN3956583.1 carboxymuconolactone decarboxylase family protein [Sporolactobacillus laevolacticus]
MNTMDFFMKEAPEAAQAFNGLIQTVAASNGLDAKVKHLIYISMKASQGDTAAVTAHTVMAKNLGATRDEVKDAILMTLTVSGIKGIASCLQPALNLFDREANE